MGCYLREEGKYIPPQKSWLCQVKESKKNYCTQDGQKRYRYMKKLYYRTAAGWEPLMINKDKAADLMEM